MGRRWRISRSCRIRQTFRIIGPSRSLSHDPIAILRVCRAANSHCLPADRRQKLLFLMGFGDFRYDRRHPKFSAEGTLRLFRRSECGCLPEQRASTESSKYHLSSIHFEFDGPPDRFSVAGVTIARYMVEVALRQDALVSCLDRNRLRLLPGHKLY